MSYKYSLCNWTNFVQSRTTLALTILITGMLFASCKKNDLHNGNPATVLLFNAMDDETKLYTHLSNGRPDVFETALVIGSNTYDIFTNLLYLKQLPQTLALYAQQDTLPKDLPVLSIDLDLTTGYIYSLFLFGTKEHPGYFIHKDIIPLINRSDSTTHVRVVNLSEGQEISVNIKGEPYESFAKKLSFKDLSTFAELSAKKEITRIEFEFRDAATGDLLATYTANNLFGSGIKNHFYSKSCTLVFVGKKGGSGTNQQKVVLINHR